VGPYPFLFACAVLCAVVTRRLWHTEIPEAGDSVSLEPVNGNAPTVPLCWLTGICLILLLGCIVLRGFGSGGAASQYVMLFPCVFAAGKALGGVVCDWAGYPKTILFIFLLSFLALQLSGLLAAVLLVLAFNMTMPLTLRLVHWCNPRYPGMMFGLAAGCLLPGVFYKGFSIPPQGMAVLQFLCLAAAGWLLRKSLETGARRNGSFPEQRN
jgi:hypothetical protein